MNKERIPIEIFMLLGVGSAILYGFGFLDVWGKYEYLVANIMVNGGLMGMILCVAQRKADAEEVESE